MKLSNQYVLRLDNEAPQYLDNNSFIRFDRNSKHAVVDINNSE
jgi:hypothetical protein